MPSPADLQGVLAKLRERFVATAGNTLAAFAQLADQLQETPAAPELVESLRRELHRVHGTAGSYGFHEASRLAGALELVAIRWAAEPAADAERRGSIVRQFVRGLGDAFAIPPDGAPLALAHRLLLVDVPDAVAAALVPEAVHRGYFVERVPSAALGGLLEGAPPQAVIASAQVRVTVPDGVPLLLLHDGASAIAPHSISARVVDAATDPAELLAIAESLSSHTRMAGASVLVVDDDPEMLALLHALGDREGLFVHSRLDAEGLEGELVRLAPALLLLDVNLPGANGILVTKRLRDDRRFATLPIVLVSGSTDVHTREAAFVAGADDFQAKPIVPAELMRRLERLLELRRQRLVASGVHPATGLWLPARTQRALEEVIASRRDGAELAVALVRPVQPPDGLQRAARWHRECARLASAVVADGGQAGFADETTLLLTRVAGAPVPGSGAGGAGGASVSALGDGKWLPSLAAATDDPATPWCAGLCLVPGDARPEAREVIRFAEDAWRTARARGEVVHRWDPAEVATAPDVVIVEDDEALADLVSFALAARGLTYQVFDTGPAALEGLRAMRVDAGAPIVLLDVDLPGLDGFSLFERLRVDRPGVFRVVFISVRASEGDQLRALRAGALDYLAKPVSLRVLMEKVGLWRKRSPGA